MFQARTCHKKLSQQTTTHQGNLWPEGGSSTTVQRILKRGQTSRLRQKTNRWWKRCLCKEDHKRGGWRRGFSQGLSATALAQACSYSSMYIAKNKSIKVNVLLYTREWAEEKALLDSGAMECFMYPHLVEKHQLPLQQLVKEWIVRNIDGTTNWMGKIMQTVALMIQHKGQATLHKFLVADIREDNIILGYPFLEAANPTINWMSGELTGEVMPTLQDDWCWIPQETGKEAWIHFTIAKTTVAQQLVEQVADKQSHMWQELVPPQYHWHGKVFSE